MLESLKLKDFQRHKRLEVELSPTVTCLVGRSGSGKSSALRALRWLVLNKPQGDSFVRHGKSRSAVELGVDGKRVVRKKGRGKNEYGLEHLHQDLGGESQDDEGGQGGHKVNPPKRPASDDVDRKDRSVGRPKSYKAFGSDPPQAIQEILNISEDSWQKQHDAPYLFSLTPGQVAQALNEIVDLEVIDRTLSKLAAGSRKARAELEVSRQRYSQAKERREALAWVRDLDADLRGVEEAEKVYKDTVERAESLRSAIEGAERIRGERDVATAQAVGDLRACQAGEVWKGIRDRAEGLRVQIAHLTRLGDERCRIETEAEELRNRASRWKACPLCGQATK